MLYIVTTRFNEYTWRENCEYRMRNNIKGCLYGSPQELSSKINYGGIVFVLEMNNTTNLIEGIGLIRNMPCSDKYYSIHSDHNYNRYVYKSNYRIDRSTIIKNNKIQLLNILRVLEYIVFYEKTHLKRGYGFAIINQTLIAKKYHDHIKKIDINTIIKTFQIIFKVVFNNI
jgi:hypothetical protein